MGTHHDQKSVVSLAVLAALAIPALAIEPAFAGPVAAGAYDLVILPTPIRLPGYDEPFKFGTDGAWNSAFMYTATTGRFAMTDNGINLTTPDFGSSIAGDGWAGILGISVDITGNVTVSSFNKDSVLFTEFGSWAQQHDDPSQITGSVDLATGTMSLVMHGRAAGVDAGDPDNACAVPLCNIPYSIDDIGAIQGVSTFTTGSAITETHGTINGAKLTSIGDINGDLVDDYKAVLVSGFDLGSAWGTVADFNRFEVWSIHLRSKPVPVPAAVWLFGSGLLGLAGIAHRRKVQPA